MRSWGRFEADRILMPGMLTRNLVGKAFRTATRYDSATIARIEKARLRIYPYDPSVNLIEWSPNPSEPLAIHSFFDSTFLDILVSHDRIEYVETERMPEKNGMQAYLMARFAIKDETFAFTLESGLLAIAPRSLGKRIEHLALCNGQVRAYTDNGYAYLAQHTVKLLNKHLSNIPQQVLDKAGIQPPVCHELSDEQIQKLQMEYPLIEALEKDQKVSRIAIRGGDKLSDLNIVWSLDDGFRGLFNDASETVLTHFMVNSAGFIPDGMLHNPQGTVYPSQKRAPIECLATNYGQEDGAVDSLEEAMEQLQGEMGTVKSYLIQYARFWRSNIAWFQTVYDFCLQQPVEDVYIAPDTD